MDLDHFKTINDVHGHLVGDAVIRQAAGALTGVLRETDHAIRYGGEEFLVIMPGLSLEQARPVADRIRAAIAGLGLDSGGPGVQVTSSIGIAERSGSEPLVDWIARADRAMYEAKDAGRDRVGLAPTPPPAPLPRSGGDPASETVPGTRTDDDDAADVITRDLDGS